MASIINATTTNGVAISADNSGILQLATNSGTTAVTIDASQNVGIGYTSPYGKLSINAGNGIDMLSSAAINIDGSTIDLNSGTSNPEEPDINPVDSSYPIKVQT